MEEVDWPELERDALTTSVGQAGSFRKEVATARNIKKKPVRSKDNNVFKALILIWKCCRRQTTLSGVMHKIA